MRLLLIFLLISLPICSAQVIMNSSVTAKPNLLFDFKLSSLAYCPNETINITSEVNNVGNLPTLFNLSKTILNQYLEIYDNVSWNDQPINPLEKRVYYFLREVKDSDIAGMYHVIIDLNYSGMTIRNQTSFRIKQSYGTLVSSPSFIEETVFPGDFINKDLYLWLMFACNGVTVTLNKSGEIKDWIYFSQNPVYLSPETWNYTRVLIFIDLPWNTLPGDYEGNIAAYINNEVVLNIPVKIHVQTSAIFDVQTEVLPQYKESCKGGEVKAKINVLKMFPPGMMDVNLTYIVQQGSNAYAQKKETIAVVDNLEKIVSLNLPNADSGLYTFHTILDVTSENWKVNISSYDTFNLIECKQPAQPISGGETFPQMKIEIKKLEIKANKYKIGGVVGNISSFEVKVKNTGEKELSSIKLKVDGVPNEWIYITPYKIDKLKVGEEKSFLVFIKPSLNAKEGVYQVNVKAVNEVESNEERLIFWLSTDERNLTLMLYEKAKMLKKNSSEILLLNCLDISSLKMQMDEANNIFALAEEYMKKEDYKKSQELFLKVIEDYEILMEKANILMKGRYYKVKIFALPPFMKAVRDAKESVEVSIEMKDYKNFCPKINILIKYVSLSLLELFIMIIILLLAIYLAYVAYKKQKERKVEERLKEIKERLGGTP
ncbi:MAG: NEW3 domain-containing protein [Candidatus Aenigmatarchaeota archaeon]